MLLRGITVSLDSIRFLRGQTGASLSDCKEALRQTDGNQDAALGVLQKLMESREANEATLVAKKRNAVEQAREDAAELKRQQAIAKQQKHREDREARIAAAEQRLEDDIAKLKQDPADAQFIAPLTLIETYDTGYKCSAGRLEGRVIRGMSCRGLFEAQTRLADTDLSWSWTWDFEQNLDEDGQEMDSRTDLEWWEWHGSGDSTWYRDDSEGTCTFSGVEGTFRQLEEHEKKYLLMLY